MKILVILLAILAASSSLDSESTPSDYCRNYLNKIKSLWKLPPPKCFKFSVCSEASWFDANAYSSFMKMYPGDSFEETSEDKFKSVCGKLLKHQAEEIHLKINESELKWTDSLREAVDGAKQEYRRRLDHFTENYIRNIPKMYSKEIQEAKQRRYDAFNKYVDGMARAAIERWSTTHDQIYQRVLSFHAKILKVAATAYQTRSRKITSLEIALDNRIDSYVAKYKQVLLDIAKAKIKAYKKLQMKVFGITDINTALGKNIRAVIRNYQIFLWRNIATSVKEYRCRLNGHRNGLISQYKKAYKIATNTGSLNFSKDAYSKYCRELGNWWKFDAEKNFKTFKYEDYKMIYKKEEYKDLTTCDESTTNEAVSDYEQKSLAQGNSTIARAHRSFAEWKTKWTKVHDDLCTKYLQIIQKRHKFLLDGFKARFYCRYGYWCSHFQNRYESYKKELFRKQTAAFESYKGALKSRYDNGCRRFNDSLAKYEGKIKQLEREAVKAYRSCMDTRLRKIQEYKQNVIAHRNELRRKLFQRLLKVAVKKCHHFTDLVSFYHGDSKNWDKCIQTLWVTYKRKVEADATKLSEEFDNHWKDLLPRLVNHYKCTYKCLTNDNLNFPQFKFDISWKIVNPSEASYSFKLKYYQRFRGYSLKNIRGRFYWSK